MMTNIQVRPVNNKQELEDMYHQRWLVFREPLGMEKGTEQDQYESSAFHLVAVCNNQVIGSARLRELSPGLGSIAYVGLLPEFRHQGIGTKLIKTLIEKAKANNFKALRLMTRINALDFYSRFGFIADGEPFDYVGISHQFMYLNLSSKGNRE
ncbi:GNAT family N-acetyltransferase [Moorena producens JHB]|uniref:GNAT family N-acetyltransferase n=1 Tax=Moorena producens (strain JHB) TaxID=1454205 RepID=A0A1D9G1Y3_MOOP1|nr:GNAT family N-acetyltransferase [Moorena producens]AOY81561.2 GNAT family N-acetyltransferase [Moorena producens JHB]